MQIVKGIGTVDGYLYRWDAYKNTLVNDDKLHPPFGDKEEVVVFSRREIQMLLREEIPEAGVTATKRELERDGYEEITHMFDKPVRMMGKQYEDTAGHKRQVLYRFKAMTEVYEFMSDREIPKLEVENEGQTKV